MTKLLAIIKRLPVLSHLLLYLWQKRHNGDKVKFWFSSHISYRCKFEGMNMVAQKLLILVQWDTEAMSDTSVT